MTKDINEEKEIKDFNENKGAFMAYNQIVAMSPIVLAYIGDATYEQMVRKRIVMEFPNEKINALHRRGVSFAKAQSQAKVVQHLRENELLTEQEWYFIKRGRNSFSAPPKNAQVTDYRYATGFEAMMGYLELSGQRERLEEIVQIAFAIVPPPRGKY